MSNIVTVIVTCTKDKRYHVAEECRLRNVYGANVRDRLIEWESRTNRYWSQRVEVRDLYSGDHWATVKSFESKYFGLDVWVCSAGFGLVRLDDHVVPYAATFSLAHPDSVAAHLPNESRIYAASTWWKATSVRWKKHFSDRPRSIASLIEENPNRSMLVVASENYMRAIVDDLRAGLSYFNDPSQLSIVSAGAKSIDGLDDNLVPCDARLQTVVGGARRSLNTRLAAKILKDSRVPPTVTALRKHYQKLLNAQPAIPKYERLQLSDAQVRAFIRRTLRTNSDLSHSPMLRILRDSNMACEQKRFASLYREVVRGQDD